MNKIVIATILASSVVLAGCDSAQDASESNFTKVINAKLAKNCIQLSPVHLFNESGFPENPIKLELPVAKDPELFNKNRLARLQLVEPFVQAGLLSEKDIQVKESFGTNLLPGKEYSLTEKGKKALSSPDAPYFCAGHYKVDEIVDFTKPSDAFGVTLSEVRYKFSPTALPEWVTPDMKKVLPELKDGQDGRISLILKNKGWSAEK